MKFTEWVDSQNSSVNKGNIFPPSLDAQTAVDFLIEYLLGEDWYCVNPISTEQINTEAVAEILWKYSRKHRKELKRRNRRIRR